MRASVLMSALLTVALVLVLVLLKTTTTTEAKVDYNWRPLGNGVCERGLLRTVNATIKTNTACKGYCQRDADCAYVSVITGPRASASCMLFGLATDCQSRLMNTPRERAHRSFARLNGPKHDLWAFVGRGTCSSSKPISTASGYFSVLDCQAVCSETPGCFYYSVRAGGLVGQPHVGVCNAYTTCSQLDNSTATTDFFSYGPGPGYVPPTSQPTPATTLVPTKRPTRKRKPSRG